MATVPGIQGEPVSERNIVWLVRSSGSVNAVLTTHCAYFMQCGCGACHLSGVPVSSAAAEPWAFAPRPVVLPRVWGGLCCPGLCRVLADAVGALPSSGPALPGLACRAGRHCSLDRSGRSCRGGPCAATAVNATDARPARQQHSAACSGRGQGPRHHICTPNPHRQQYPDGAAPAAAAEWCEYATPRCPCATTAAVEWCGYAGPHGSVATTAAAAAVAAAAEWCRCACPHGPAVTTAAVAAAAAAGGTATHAANVGVYFFVHTPFSRNGCTAAGAMQDARASRLGCCCHSPTSTAACLCIVVCAHHIHGISNMQQQHLFGVARSVLVCTAVLAIPQVLLPAVLATSTAACVNPRCYKTPNENLSDLDLFAAPTCKLSAPPSGCSVNISPRTCSRTCFCCRCPCKSPQLSAQQLSTAGSRQA
jgi:hypothetical protein